MVRIHRIYPITNIHYYIYIFFFLVVFVIIFVTFLRKFESLAVNKASTDRVQLPNLAWPPTVDEKSTQFG